MAPCPGISCPSPDGAVVPGVLFSYYEYRMIPAGYPHKILTFPPNTVRLCWNSVAIHSRVNIALQATDRSKRFVTLTITRECFLRYKFPPPPVRPEFRVSRHFHDVILPDTHTSDMLFYQGKIRAETLPVAFEPDNQPKPGVSG